jgi:hypothetical protein
VDAVSAPTVRRYPRTLAQAWPREHANPIEFYPEPGYRKVMRAAWLLGLVVFIAWCAAQGV